MDMSDEEWEKQVAEFHKICYAYVYSIGGRLSGEHGIGAKKLHALSEYCDPVEMSIMKTIKRAMDPNNVLNPGKLIDAQWIKNLLKSAKADDVLGSRRIL